MKRKIHKILGVGLTLVMAVSLIAAFAAPVAASPDEEAWSTFDLPGTGAAGDWFMDTTIDGLGPIAKAIDGTLYLYVDFMDGDDDLFKSTDEGRTWEATDYATGTSATTINAIAVFSDDADVLYVADATNVYKTEDAGDSWSDLGAVIADGATPTSLAAINSLAVGYADDEPHIFVGGVTATTVGGVFYYKDAPFAAKWIDLNVTPAGNNVFGIACSPDFANDTLVVAVVVDALNSYVTANEGAGIGPEKWDSLELLDGADVPTAFVITGATNPVFVEDFDIDDDYELFVGVSGPAHGAGTKGGVYRITGMDDADDFLLDDVVDDIVSLDLVGDLGGTSLMAGGASVWYSTDDGDSWDETDKAPTGEDATANLVIVDDDFADSGIAWCASDAVTKEGGVHLTTDFGATWNGISMLDTDMAGAVYDVAFTLGYGEDDTPLFLVTESSVGAGVDNSVWKYDGTNWERVWLDTTNNLDLVEVSPAFADDEAVFVADSNATPAVILYSHNGGATFTEMTRPPDEPITSWLVIDDETVITGDATGNYYKTTRYGRRAWDKDAISAGNAITDFALSPNFATDGTILTGNAASQVFISTDEGEEWDEVSASDLKALTTSDGATYVAFDPGYADNNTIYAASGDTIARSVIDPGEDWGDQVIDDMGALDGFLDASGIVVSDDGTLYAADATAVASEATEGVAQADADSFTIVNTSDAATTATLTVTSGIVTFTGTTGTDFTGGPPVYTLTFPATVGASITVEASAANSYGVWQDDTVAAWPLVANITVDADGDASIETFAPSGYAPAPWSLPDAEIPLEEAAPAGSGGVTRCLNPTDGLADIVFELPLSGLKTGETLAGLELTYGSNNILWAIDTAAALEAIWTYEDTLAAPVILKSPADGASIPDTDEATFKWEDLNADTVEFYQLELNEYADFSGPDLGATGIDDNTWSTGADALTAGTKYYWRVTVTDPVSSRTSAEWSLITKVAAVEEPVAVRPLPGAQDIILLPTFSWLDMPGAASYDIEIAPTAAFTAGVIKGTSPVNAWLIDVELEYSTTYYWRVRGISASGAPAGDWVVSVFTTMAEPVPAPPPVVVEPTPPPVVEVPAPEMITPTWIYAIIGIGAALAVVVIVLIVRTRRVP